MHLIIIMLFVIAAALVGARMLPSDEDGVVRLIRWTLFALAGGALLLMVLTIVAALFE